MQLPRIWMYFHVRLLRTRWHWSNIPLNSPSKWKFVEYRSCCVPLKFSDILQFIKVFKLFSFLLVSTVKYLVGYVILRFAYNLGRYYQAERNLQATWKRKTWHHIWWKWRHSCSSFAINNISSMFKTTFIKVKPSFGIKILIFTCIWSYLYTSILHILAWISPK